MASAKNYFAAFGLLNFVIHKSHSSFFFLPMQMTSNYYWPIITWMIDC